MEAVFQFILFMSDEQIEQMINSSCDSEVAVDSIVIDYSLN